MPSKRTRRLPANCFELKPEECLLLDEYRAHTNSSAAPGRSISRRRALTLAIREAARAERIRMQQRTRLVPVCPYTKDLFPPETLPDA